MQTERLRWLMVGACSIGILALVRGGSGGDPGDSAAGPRSGIHGSGTRTASNASMTPATSAAEPATPAAASRFPSDGPHGRAVADASTRKEPVRRTGGAQTEPDRAQRSPAATGSAPIVRGPATPASTEERVERIGPPAAAGDPEIAGDGIGATRSSENPKDGEAPLLGGRASRASPDPGVQDKPTVEDRR